MRFRLSILLALLAIFMLGATAAEKVKGPVGVPVAKHSASVVLEGFSPPCDLPPVGSRNPNTLDEVIISEGFEGLTDGTLPAGWTQVDVDGGNCGQFARLSTWQAYNYGINAHTGTNVAMCHYNDAALPNDDWLIIPVGALEAPITFSYWRSSQDVNYLDSYELKISTTGTVPANFTNLIVDENNVPVAWVQNTYDLSAYAGAAFYIGFHYNSIDEFVFKLDDILLEASGSGPTGSITGTVTDAETTLPLSGVLVVASTATATTVANGSYTMENVPVGTHSVVFTKQGYDPTTVTGVVITADQTTTVNAQMTEAIVPPTVENNSCSDPFEVPEAGEYLFSTLAATLDGPNLDSCWASVTFGADIWMSYLAPSDGDLTVSTCNTADYDSRIACYSNGTATAPVCPLSAVDFDICSDDGDACGLTSEFTIAVSANVNYLIRVGGYTTGDVGTGTISFSIDSPPAPAIVVSTDELDFGIVEVGVPTNRTFTVSNTGTAVLSVTSITCPTGYTASPQAFALGAGATPRTVTVIFTAPDAGTFEGDLSIVSNAPTSPTLVHVTGGTLAANENPGLAESYYVATSYPNPFNPETTISFAIPKAEFVNVTIYNSIGQAVALLNDGRLDAGRHDFNFNAADLPSGLYFARITSDGFTQTLKTVLMK